MPAVPAGGFEFLGIGVTDGYELSCGAGLNLGLLEEQALLTKEPSLQVLNKWLSKGNDR